MRKITKEMIDKQRVDEGLFGANDDEVREHILALDSTQYAALKRHCAKTQKQPEPPPVEPDKPVPEVILVNKDLWARVKEVVGAAASCEHPVSLSKRANPLYKLIRNIKG